MADQLYNIYSELVDLNATMKRLAQGVESQLGQNLAAVAFDQTERLGEREQKLVGAVAYWKTKCDWKADDYTQACLAQAQAELRTFRKQHR